MEKLNETHKRVLCFLAEAVRTKRVPEEFVVRWPLRGDGSIFATTFLGIKGLKVPNLTKLCCDLLTKEGLLFSYVRTSTTTNGNTQTQHESYRTCIITQKGHDAVDSNFASKSDVVVPVAPVEITGSLAKFRKSYPDPNRLAFVMMQFGKSRAHKCIIAAIRDILLPYGFLALRADDREYHQDVFRNIQTYIHGTLFGIAVFERIEADSFNPNVSLEVGYMMGLGRQVCLLKEQTLTTLQTDLSGRLYRPFDVQNAEETIRQQLIPWMQDQEFIPRT